MKIARSRRSSLSNAAFVRGGCIMLIVMVALLWGGGQEIFTAIKNRKPVVMTCKDYAQNPPSAEWVTVTDARFDFVNAAFSQSKVGKDIKEVFIPLRCQGESFDSPIKILMASKKPETLQMMDGLHQLLDGSKTSANQDTAITKLGELHSVSGLVRFGIRSDSKTLEQLGELHLPLAANYVVINEGEEPNAVVGLIMFGIGLLLLGYNIKRALKSPDLAPAPSKLPPPLPPPLPPQ